MVNPGDAVRKVKNLLAEAGIDDAAFEAAQLFEHVAGESRFLAADLTNEQWQRLQMLAQKRAQRYPLQYLLGSWAFMGLELEVGPGVLIPRPETEEVCEAALGVLRAKMAPAVLDLCAGTGALALGIQKNLPQATVTAVELQEAAFDFLRRNCGRYAGEWERVPQAVCADALEYYKTLPPAGLDLIVSNPPYVTEKEYKALAPELYFEPQTALVAPEDGLLFYRRIADAYKPALKPGGALVFEIGAGQGEAVEGILFANGYTAVEVRRDAAGNPRIALAKNE